MNGRAVSKVKRNSGLMNGSGGYRSGCEHTFEHREWRMKGMCSTRSAVEAVGDGIEFVLTVDREVSALWQVLTQQPVSVLTGAALPGTVRIAEVHAHASGGAELLMAGHFLALVVRKCLAEGGGDRGGVGREAPQGRGGGAVFHFA